MNKNKAISYVARQLGLFRSRDNIAKELAKRGTLDYYQAQQFIRYVETSHGRKIAMTRLPIVLAIGIPGLLVGLFLAVGFTANIYYEGVSIRGVIYGFLGIALTLGSFFGMLSVVWKLLRG